MPEESHIPKFHSISEKLESKMKASKEQMANGVLNEHSDEQFMSSVKKAKTAVVMFYRTTCPYCKQLTPILEELAEDFKERVYFAKVNIDKVEGASEDHSIMGVPVTIAFKKGFRVGRIDGLRKESEYENWIESIAIGVRPMGIDSGVLTEL